MRAIATYTKQCIHTQYSAVVASNSIRRCGEKKQALHILFETVGVGKNSMKERRVGRGRPYKGLTIKVALLSIIAALRSMAMLILVC